MGLTMASSGYEESMRIYGWIGFWRFILGIGLGAESRGRMMAAVFMMQAVAQLTAYALGIAILHGIGHRMGLPPGDERWTDQNSHEARRVIDVVWRVIIGIGAIPAFISLFLRRLIPETPHYLAEQGKVDDAVEAAGLVYAPGATLQPAEQANDPSEESILNIPVGNVKKAEKGLWAMTIRYFEDIWDHLAENGRWRPFLGIAAAWFLLDLAYYGLGLDNPKAISAIWLSEGIQEEDHGPDQRCNGDAWRSDISWPNITIFETLEQNCIRNIETISSGALPGSIVALLAIDYLPRTTWTAWMFVALAALFAINGGTFFVTFMTDKHALTITLYVLAQFIFNIGPNTMTFILAAELFPTKYRGTFYGIAAASGKLGAIVIQLVLNFSVFSEESALYVHKFAGVLLGFSVTMLLGALVTWTWIPEVQYPRGSNADVDFDENASENGLDMGEDSATFRQKLKLPNRSLADIAQRPGEGHILGMRKNIAHLFRKKQRTHGRRDGRSPSSMHADGGRNDSANQRYQPVYTLQDDYLEEADVGDGIEMRHVGDHSPPGFVAASM
ncbi:hypothetical protein DL771_003336 [Monosporascus sp. 5C6A]|nr:hypothetical protein DL771_003336 [Monosporascus sp. 5C6A]